LVFYQITGSDSLNIEYRIVARNTAWLDTDGSVQNKYTITPGGEGVTWDGTYMWTTHQAPDTIYQRGRDGTVISKFSSKGHATGITWDGKSLFNSDTSQNIYQLVGGGGFDMAYNITTSGTPKTSSAYGAV